MKESKANGPGAGSRLLVSVHLPKTAGVSFLAALRQGVPSGVQRDYEDAPINTPVAERIAVAFRSGVSNIARDFSGIRCIHGHFLPVKYLPLATIHGNVEFVTWMRHPVDRVVSHYRYWMRNYNPATSQPFHRRVVEEGWALEKFCLSTEMRNLYGQFLFAFPLENFHFIGITEHYDEDLADFSRRYFGADLAAERLNTAPTEVAAKVDPGLLRDIEHHHSSDMVLYSRALELRAARHPA